MPELKHIAIEKLQPGEYQPRKHFDKEKLAELAASIKSVGLLQPLVVRPVADDHYEIIAGERRWRAAQMAELREVPCLVHPYQDSEAAEITAIENIIRVDLNAIEVAEAYQRLIDEFAYNHEQVALAVGKSRTKITNALRLLNLDKRVQVYVKTGRLSEGHAKMLASLSPEQQIALAIPCMEQGWSVRRIEQEVKRLQTGNALGLLPGKNINVANLERALAEYLGTPVSIDYNNNSGHGKFHVKFHNLDILKGILQKIGFEE